MRYFLFKFILCGLVSLSFAHAKEHKIRIVTDYEKMKMTFEPKILHIALGDKVTWVNEVAETHDIISYPNGYPKGAKPLASPYLEKAGQTWSHVFQDVEGTYDYHCIPHIMMEMTGQIIVGEQKTAMNNPSVQEKQVYRKKILEFFDETNFKDFPKYVSHNLNVPVLSQKNKQEETIKTVAK